MAATLTVDQNVLIEPVDASCAPLVCSDVVLRTHPIIDDFGVYRGQDNKLRFRCSNLDGQQISRLLNRHETGAILTSYLMSSVLQWIVPRVGVAVIGSVEGIYSGSRAMADVRATIIPLNLSDPRSDFIQPIIQDPNDPILRHVYADWLDDHGFHEEAARHRQRAISI